MILHLDANPGGRGSMACWGRDTRVLRVKKGVTLREEHKPVLYNRTESEAFDFDLLKVFIGV